MPRICIPDDYPPVLAPSAVFPALQSRAQLDYYDTLPGTEDALIARIADAEAALNIRSSSFFTERVFAACPQLRLVSIWGTGTDHVDLASAARHNVAVANTPGVSARSIAEHTLALLFAVARRIPHMDAATRRGVWERGQSIELYGKTAGILGYGAVGREFARLALGIGMKVITWTMHPEHYAGVPFTDLDDLYRAADVVSVHLRLSPETRSFIAAPQFASMKPGAILINTARGGLVDPAALVSALRSGQLAAAGLDVFEAEPADPADPLLALPNVVLTPHIGWLTSETFARSFSIAAENCRRLAAGETLLHQVA